MEVGSSTLPGTTHGGLAQLARAPALQAGGQRFESVILHCVFRHFGDLTDEFIDILQTSNQFTKELNRIKS